MRTLSILLCIVIFILSGCQFQTQVPATTEPMLSTAQANWDVKSYERPDGVTEFRELEDKVEGVRSWKILFESDGVPIVCYLSIPEDCLNNKVPYSCLVYARGGTMHYGYLTQNETANFARGLNTVVISAEYRGTGRCEGKDECGGAELNDFLKLIDFCEEFAFVDMDRLYMMGPSRGGMTTYQAICVDSRIKKAIVHSGLADMFRSMEERKDLRENYFRMIGGSPEEVPEEYEKRSAVYWADKFLCPVLIFHSKGDPRVSYRQAEDLVTALNDAGKEYHFVSYDDDVHGSHPEDWLIVREWCDFGAKGED